MEGITGLHVQAGARMLVLKATVKTQGCEIVEAAHTLMLRSTCPTLAEQPRE